ncbi:MAG TPA: DPP IV N-terminal domain-containing protein [Phycisphaerae bacterium]|nr:DPP IV N-terminal domain-containing protein [Phycisphaerae bacterium]
MKRFPIAQFSVALAAMVTLGLAIGCSVTPKPPAEAMAQPQVAPPADELPVLPEPDPAPRFAAAGDRQINLFGELPNRADVPYFTRTASSLLQHTFAEEGADFDPCISPDGKWMVFASTRHNVAPDLYYKQIDGIAVTQLTSDPASDIQPVFSPDGKRVAFASDRSGNWDIWVVSLDGTQPVQITATASDEIHPSWSPDSARLTYCSLPTQGQWELWVADATTGGGKKRFIGYGLFPTWSPNSDTILYQRARERGSHWFSVWTIQLVDGEPRYPTEVAAAADAALITPSWSRDGKQIAYAAVTPSGDGSSLGASPQTADIWVVDIDGRNRVRLTDGHTANFGPAWSPNKRVFFTSGREGHETIWSLLPEVGPGQEPTMTASGNDAPPPARTASDQ